MKIWVVGRGYPTVYNGMRGSFELDQAKLLARHGHDVTYLSLNLTFFSRKDPRGIRHFTEDSVNIFAYSHLFLPGSVIRKLGIHFEKYEEKCWHKLFCLAKKNSGLPDILHIHYPTMICNIKEVEKLRKKGVKVFVTEHWSNVLIKNLKKYEHDRLRYYTANSNCFFSVSSLLQDSIKSIVSVSVPMRVVPNMVSPVFFQPYSIEKDDIFTFIVISRLVPLKQIDKIVNQFIRCFSANKRVRLVIVGAGSEKKIIQRIANAHSNIQIKGELMPQEVAKELAKSDALVSFSKYETFAVPVSEALAAGKPVIVSSSSGVSVLVSRDYGIVVNETKPGKLGDAMKEIIANYNNYNSDTISQFAKNNFSDEAVYSKLISEYARN